MDHVDDSLRLGVLDSSSRMDHVDALRLGVLDSSSRMDHVGVLDSSSRMDLVAGSMRSGGLALDRKLSQMNSEYDKPVSQSLAIDEDLLDKGYGIKSPVHVAHANLVNYETSVHKQAKGSGKHVSLEAMYTHSQERHLTAASVHVRPHQRRFTSSSSSSSPRSADLRSDLAHHRRPPLRPLSPPQTTVHTTADLRSTSAHILQLFDLFSVGSRRRSGPAQDQAKEGTKKKRVIQILDSPEGEKRAKMKKASYLHLSTIQVIDAFVIRFWKKIETTNSYDRKIHVTRHWLANFRLQDLYD
ncbi:uncharacterized protein A4U43_C03F17050 [Asparagus officinalis]|uniref:Uncharacterized protein n=1 Tax=Asparagus officinalis TaxID=4686 RepID=A0A5P1FAR1_ASPOF|nr:uncharacterized protein A4U43_C03F17050 [Asparagus officinalis]